LVRKVFLACLASRDLQETRSKVLKDRLDRLGNRARKAILETRAIPDRLVVERLDPLDLLVLQAQRVRRVTKATKEIRATRVQLDRRLSALPSHTFLLTSSALTQTTT
jgi:hypothetical protein